MHARSLVAAAAILALSCGPATARDLTLVARPPTQDAIKEVFVRPFTEATAIAVQTESWEGGIDALRTQAKTPDNALGPRHGGQRRTRHRLLGGPVREARLVGDRRQGPLPAAGGQRLRRRRRRREHGAGLGPRQIPRRARLGGILGRREVPGQARPARAACAATWSSPCSPTACRPPTSTRCSRTSEGVDRAFRRLDQLKPYIVWWSDDAEAARILASGDVLMTSASAPAIAVANRASRRNFGVQWAASLYEVQSWAVLKGSPNLRAATQYLYFAGTPAIEARLVGLFGEGGLAKGANDGLPAELAPGSRRPHRRTCSAAVRVDAGFWHDNLAKLRQRFESLVDALTEPARLSIEQRDGRVVHGLRGQARRGLDRFAVATGDAGGGARARPTARRSTSARCRSATWPARASWPRSRRRTAKRRSRSGRRSA